MARVATKNTYGTETIGGVEVRRLVKAGDQVPAHYEVDADAVREVEGAGDAPGSQASAAIVQPDEGSGDAGGDAGDAGSTGGKGGGKK